MSCGSIDLAGAYNFGCFAHCFDICLPIVATQTGIHVISFKNKGQFGTNKVFATAGNTIKLNNVFNESAPVTFEIIQPDCTNLTHTVDGVIYYEFYLSTEITIHVTNEVII